MPQNAPAPWSVDPSPHDPPPTSAPSALAALSVDEYHAAHRHQRSIMSSNGAPAREPTSDHRRPPRAWDLLYEGLEEGEEVDYRSDDPVAGDTPSPPARGRSSLPPTPERRHLRTLNPFPQGSLRHAPQRPSRTGGDDHGVITNDLDNVREQRLHSSLRPARSQRPVARPIVSSRSEYGFEPRDPAIAARDATSQSPLTLRLRAGGRHGRSDRSARRTA
ncbi:unnamed protein product [Phytophthora lilii]|uniref:Unnamed protein product n=1 Tax=Phytophthora lilii TaxID=2077276 RepID=A0A9W7CTD7_9STRA|nr:unnamed protein product [Phytophthora lilii]